MDLMKLEVLLKNVENLCDMVIATGGEQEVQQAKQTMMLVADTYMQMANSVLGVNNSADGLKKIMKNGRPETRAWAFGAAMELNKLGRLDNGKDLKSDNGDEQQPSNGGEPQREL